MTFIFPLLLGGLILTGVPLLLHLIMRQKPKHLMFPAFRFLLQRHRSTQRKIRIRHLLLLALRMGLIAGVCLALARPKIFSERLNLSSERPVAAVLVFDTSASMSYIAGGRSLLDEAKRRAQELLDTLPLDSRVAVLDTAEPGGEWLPSVSLAKERVAELRPRPANGPITSRLGEAYRLLADVGQAPELNDESLPRFLYIFSDRMQACWDTGRVKDLQQFRDRIGLPIHAVFVDVGLDKPVDIALVAPDLPHQVVPADGQFIIRATVRATGADCDTEVRCRIDNEETPERKPIRLLAGQSQVLSFERRDLPTGLHQVELALASTDALPFNNACFATFEVRGGRRVLIVADDPHDASFWQLALESSRGFTCDVRTPLDIRSLGPNDLASYKAVCLLGVARPDPELWKKLDQYVRNGGGLAVVPGGEEMDSRAYNTDEVAQRLLPGQFTTIVKNTEGAEWNIANYQHPIMVPFREWDQAQNVDFRSPLSLPLARRYWEIKPSPVGAYIIVPYAGKEGRPALLERSFDPKEKVRGRVLLYTTAFDVRHVWAGEGRDLRPDEEWNNYVKNSFYLVLVNKTVGYLAGDAEEANFNYLSGQAVAIVLPEKPRFPNYTLQGPGVGAGEAVVTRAGNQNELALPQAVAPGNYTLFGSDAARTASFSVNLPPEESQLVRVPAEQIESLLGTGALLPVGRDVSLHDALQGRWDQPVELFPWLMILVLLVLAVENLLANKFYRRESTAEEPSSSTPWHVSGEPVGDA